MSTDEAEIRNLFLEPPEDLSEEEKSDWKRERNFIIGPMTIVTTVSPEGVPNAALKTNLTSMGSLDRLLFGCKLDHDTYQNIEQNGEFVVNFSTNELHEEAIATAHDFPSDVNELEKVDLTAISSQEVKPPRIKECAAHYECKVDWIKKEPDKDYSAIIMGEIVAASVKEGFTERSLNNLLFWVGGSRGGDHYGTVRNLIDFPITDFLSEIEEDPFDVKKEDLRYVTHRYTYRHNIFDSPLERLKKIIGRIKQLFSSSGFDHFCEG